MIGVSRLLSLILIVLCLYRLFGAIIIEVDVGFGYSLNPKECSRYFSINGIQSHLDLFCYWTCKIRTQMEPYTNWEAFLQADRFTAHQTVHARILSILLAFLVTPFLVLSVICLVAFGTSIKQIRDRDVKSSTLPAFSSMLGFISAGLIIFPIMFYGAETVITSPDPIKVFIFIIPDILLPFFLVLKSFLIILETYLIDKYFQRNHPISQSQYQNVAGNVRHKKSD